jgi:hypothetical protein
MEKSVTRKPVVLTVIAISVLALVGVAALAVGPKPEYFFSQDGRILSSTKLPHTITPTGFRDPSLKTIAGNLSTYRFGTFYCCLSDDIAQGGAHFPFQTWLAVPFTPTANATVTRIEAPIGVFPGATGGFELSLREDNAGIPGRVLKSFHIANPIVFGTCCVLDLGNDKAGIPVTAGTQYWLAGTTTKGKTDFVGAWALTSTDMRSYTLAVWCKSTGNQCGANNGKWALVSSGDPMPAYAVLGH